jgi:hypothetical protein
VCIFCEPFFSHQVELLRQWVTQMWLYPGPSCPDRPFSEELGKALINTRIYKVLDYGAGPNPMASPIPLGEGVDSTRVSPFSFTFGSMCNLIHSSCLCTFAGSRVCSQCATGGHLTRGRGEAGSEPCPR